MNPADETVWILTVRRLTRNRRASGALTVNAENDHTAGSNPIDKDIGGPGNYKFARPATRPRRPESGAFASCATAFQIPKQVPQSVRCLRRCRQNCRASSVFQAFGPVALAPFRVSNGDDQDDLIFLLIDDGERERAKNAAARVLGIRGIELGILLNLVERCGDVAQEPVCDAWAFKTLVLEGLFDFEFNFRPQPDGFHAHSGSRDRMCFKFRPRTGGRAG